MKNYIKKVFVLFIISISFLGSNLAFAEAINPPAEEPLVILMEIAITSAMEEVKTDYFVGEELDLTGLEVTGTYSDSSTQIETINTDNITGFDSSSPFADQILTITVLDKTTTYQVDINIVSLPVVENKITIRNGESIIYDGKVLFPETEEKIEILGQEVSNQSVLGLLYMLDQNEDSFLISDLIYNESFGAFLLNCITPNGSEALCYNWQYVIDGYYPEVGMDKNILLGGENIYLFFGQTDRILLSISSINTGEDLIVTTEKYDFENNEWLVKTGAVVGITKVNPDDPYNPIEIQSGPVDENGQKVFSSIPVGSYSAGIKIEDDGFSYYWPTVNFEVIESSSGGSSGGGGGTPSLSFSIPDAISFLLANQNPDGSFQNDMYTDWVAIASAKTNEGNQLKSKVYNYIINNEFESSIITDYERHIMAMMALGINPYNGTDIDYIKKITDAFDGEQIGDPSLINDDIFGLIVLAHAGFSKNDEIIKKISSHIIRDQQTDGSWESVDMTSSAIQVLRNFKNLSGVNDAIEKGELYLLSEQNNDGGFDNSFSTSWVIQALAQNSTYENEVENAISYLGNQQKEDGGIDDGSAVSRIWATAYAIPAILKLSWHDILESYEKEGTEDNSSDEESEEVIIDDEKKDEEIVKEITEEAKKEDEKVITNNISSKKQVVSSKHEDKINNNQKQILNQNNLMASAEGALIETNEDQSLIIQTIYAFFQKMISYIKIFWLSLLSLI